MTGFAIWPLVNTYYMAAEETTLRHAGQKRWSEAVRMVFPNAAGRGSHIGISGVALMKHAPNKDAAIQLIEYLASDIGQHIFAATNYMYRLRLDVPVSELVWSWGVLVPDELPLAEIARLRNDARALLEEVSFDSGPGT
ncbi:MAG: hypothetical protein ACREC6_10995 [Hyphomicrobiaceae bacterium]